MYTPSRRTNPVLPQTMAVSMRSYLKRIWRHLESELGRREGRDGGLLTGPQSQAEVQNQDDIDAVFENLG